MNHTVKSEAKQIQFRSYVLVLTNPQRILADAVMNSSVQEILW